MKKAFSLLEIIIGILIIGLISSFAIPKLMDTKDFASATTLKRDIFSIISSAQTYNLSNPNFDNISSAIDVNGKIWDISGNILADNSQCLNLEYSSSNSSITLTSLDSTNEICVKLYEEIDLEDTKTYEL